MTEKTDYLTVTIIVILAIVAAIISRNAGLNTGIERTEERLYPQILEAEQRLEGQALEFVVLGDLQEQLDAALNEAMALGVEVGDQSRIINELQIELSIAKQSLDQRWNTESAILGTDIRGNAILFSDGIWLIGDDIDPGVYMNFDAPLKYDDEGKPISECWWAVYTSLTTDYYSGRVSDRGSIYNIVQIEPTDKVFVSEFCGIWEKID